MIPTRTPPTGKPDRVVRVVLGVATIALLIFAFGVRNSLQLWAIAAAVGTAWWASDLLTEYVFRPFGEWVTDVFMSGGVGVDDAASRPKLDDLIRLLEGHIARGTSQKVDINAAIRLEEIYRTVKKDPARAKAVMEIVRTRYPNAPELMRHERASREFLGAEGAGEADAIEREIEALERLADDEAEGLPS
jgi:hypothetical protein